MSFIHLSLVLVFLLTSCSEIDNKKPKYKTVELFGRDNGITIDKPLIYRIKMPLNWTENPIDKSISLIDTTKPIHEFFIKDEFTDETIRITIHNFPVDDLKNRIPPFQQINRWKKQLENMNESTVVLKNQSFGGYSGLYFEATGLIQDKPTKVLGWSIQLAPEHFRALSYVPHKSLEHRFRQMRGDVTIKAVGLPHLLQKNRDEIINFARSFQLIDDIP